MTKKVSKNNKKRSDGKKNASRLAIKKQQTLPPELNHFLKQAYGFHQQGKLTDAAQGYQKILNLFPYHAEANFLFGMLLFNQGQLPHAENFFNQALEANPTELRYLMAIGVLYLRTGRFENACAIFDKAHKIAPRDFEPLFNLGTAKTKLNRFTEAVNDLEQALKINPKHTGLLNNLGNAYLGLCEIKQSSNYYQKAFDSDRTLFAALSNFLVNSHYQNDLSAQEVYDLHLQAAQYYPKAEVHSSTPSLENSKIRIGYFSADFRVHSVAYFLHPLLKHHDKSQFEIYCYYNGDKIDDMTRSFQSLADKWAQTASLSDAQLVQRIRQDQLDIVVDLAGHTGQNRAPVFAHRVATTQINWLGYPHSTGIPAMDYRIVDDVTDPSPQADQYSTENLLRVPGGFLCYEGDSALPYQDTPPNQNKGYITFGSFNNFAKVTDEVIDTWSQVLASLPDSRMLIKAKQLGEDRVRARVTERFEQHGIAANRVELLASVPSTAEHLALYDRVDIALDSFPYNGTTTTCEALWMGVPTITFIGDRHAARVSASILKQVGLEDYIAVDKDSYIAKAIERAQDTQSLQNLRQNLRQQVQASSLCNAANFAQEMEALYQSVIK